MDIGKDTSRSNSDVAEQLVEFLVVLHSQSNVTGNDAALLVVASGVSSEFQDFGTKVFENACQIDGSTGTHAGGVLALAQISADTTDGELEAGLLTR